MDLILNAKIVATCFVIWLVCCLIVEISGDKPGKDVLPDWFWYVAVLNALIGFVVFIITILMAVWS
jgi:lipid-A-disaccharide synthase-like uncharacterized protein